MQEARFKIKHVSQIGRQWESLPFVAVVINYVGLAPQIAEGMAQVPGVYEVRWNWAGRPQGYYTRGGK